MMMSNNTSAVYRNVMEAVVNNVKDDLFREGVNGDSILAELQAIWESKMVERGVVQGPVRSSSSRGSGVVQNLVDNLDVPYEGTLEYIDLTRESPYPAASSQKPVQTPISVKPDLHQYLPSDDNERLPDSGSATNVNSGRPTQYMKASLWTIQRPHGLAVNTANEGRRQERGERVIQTQSMVGDVYTLTSGRGKLDDYSPYFLTNRYIPQQDGSADSLLVDSSSQKIPFTDCSNRFHNTHLEHKEWRNFEGAISSMDKTKQASTAIPQYDGHSDFYNNRVSSIEDYNTPSYYDTVTSVESPKPGNIEGVQDEEPPLDENDDDLDDLELKEVEQNARHLVLAQFEKVGRTKNKWKCVFKDGVMQLNNREILFSKANANFQF